MIRALGLVLLSLLASSAAQALELVEQSPDKIPALSLVLRGYEDGRDLNFTRQIAPGVVLKFDTFSTGPLTLNTVIIDPRRENLHLEVEKAKDQIDQFETVLAMSQRLNQPGLETVFAINADFWAGKHPVGMLVDEGWIWKSPYDEGNGITRSVFAFDDQGNFNLGIPQFRATLSPTNSTGQFTPLVIDQINVQGDGNVTAYTPVVFKEFPTTSEGTYRVIVALDEAGWLPNKPVSGTIKVLNTTETSPLNNQSIGLESLVPFPQWVVSGATVSLTATYKNLPGVVTGATGGGPMLLTDGKILTFESAAEESVSDDFVTTLHPRTAVGIRANGELVFVTVDGRQGGRSIGIDLFELAKYMKSQGCVQAMNLDGGGSTSLFVGGEVVNFPSSKGVLRPVTTAIVVQQKKDGAARSEVITEEVLPRNLRVPTLDGIEFFQERRTNFGAEGMVVTPVENKDDLPLGTVEIVEAATIEFSEGSFTYSPGEVKPFSPRVLDKKGVPLTSRFIEFTVQTPDFIAYDEAARTLTATGKGVGELTVKVPGGLKKTFPVSSGAETVVMVESFDELASTSKPTGVKFNKQKSTLHLNTLNKFEGQAALIFGYGMLGETGEPAEKGTSKISVPVEHEFPENAVAARMVVYGDGKGQWLRSEWRDANNQRFVLSWTDGANGISWNGEWRVLTVKLSELEAIGSHSAPPKSPFRIETIYLVQTNEAKKANSEILLDALEAVVPEI